MCYKQYVPSEEFCTMWDECADSIPHHAGWCERSVYYYTVHSEVSVHKEGNSLDPSLHFEVYTGLRLQSVQSVPMFLHQQLYSLASLASQGVQWSAHKDGDSRPPRRHPSLVSPLLPVASSHTHAFHHAPIKANNKLPNLHIITRCHSFFWDSISSSKTWTVNILCNGIFRHTSEREKGGSKKMKKNMFSQFSKVSILMTLKEIEKKNNFWHKNLHN